MTTCDYPFNSMEKSAEPHGACTTVALSPPLRYTSEVGCMVIMPFAVCRLRIGSRKRWSGILVDGLVTCQGQVEHDSHIQNAG